MAYRTIPTKPSANIFQVQYDEETKDLLVVFVRQGRRYVFHDVDSRTVEGFSRAESAGRYFNAEVKDLFPFEEV